MQIKRIEIAGFGKFSQQTFDLSSGLQVFYGANETGKSTLRAFILGLLFGFPSRRYLLARYEPKTTSQYGGSLDLMVQGQLYRLTRLGDQPAELVKLSTMAPQPLSLLAHWLMPYDETSYKQLFTFNQAELTALKSLSATDLNQQLQQVGTLGSAPWRATAAALRTSADTLYKPRGRKPELNQRLKAYQGLTDQVQAARQRYPDYQQLQQQVQQLTAQQTQLNQHLSAANATQQTLANLRNQWPVYQQLQQLQAQSTATDPALSAATVHRYQQLSTTQTDLQHTLASARQQLSQQPVDRDSQGVLGFYIAHQAQFETLEAQLPQLQQALGRYRTLAGQATAAKADYQQQLSAHPELTASLSPQRQAALTALKTALLTSPSRQQQRQTTKSPQVKLDWRLYAVGGVVAVLGLPVFGLKWLLWCLILVGVGLLGWVGWHSAHQSASVVPNETALSAELTAAGLAPDLDPVAAQTQLALIDALQRAQATVTQAEQQLAAQTVTVGQALADYQFAAAWLPVNDQQLVDSVDRITAFYDQIHQMMQTQTMAGPDFAYTQRQVQQLTAQVRTVTAQLQQLATENQLADATALGTAIAAQADQVTRQTNLTQLAGQLTTTEQQALAQYETLSDLQAAVTTNRQQQTELQTQLAQQTETLVTVQTQLAQLTADGRYTELRQQQANQQTEMTVLARQWLTRQLGATWIEQALQQLTNQQLPTIMGQATTYFAQLTRQRYNEIKLVGDDLVVQATTGPAFAVAELSTATKEQLYLALRLALIVHLGDQATLPIMIDDGFVNFDEERRLLAWQLLATVATQHQILYFTNETAALTAMNATTVHKLT
ncbi:hypothetical protein C5Z25_11575 [Lactobacillus sp. CBA3605]|uniref:ATP-binding protein n=1 Tax=Lactobacillus sp. CBA3605 TaxID=2099788 RepID=UPI000CFE2534|nr:AAA family ATPase [Lactobacillus sp. CBA3605]AVK62356.1 hypothetical protein C5Z25_11575 [Lactobacillus sp. CBA3605]